MVQLELEPAFRMSSNLGHGYYSINPSTITVAHGTSASICTMGRDGGSPNSPESTAARSIRLKLSYSPATSSRTADRAGDLAEIHHMHHTVGRQSMEALSSRHGTEMSVAVSNSRSGRR